MLNENLINPSMWKICGKLYAVYAVYTLPFTMQHKDEK